MNRTIQKIRSLAVKYREQISYVFFGGCTTLVNWGIYWLLAKPLGCSISFATATAWVLSVLFAYVTNRIWVFQSKASGIRAVWKEILSFYSSRVLTGLLDYGCMLLFAERLGLNDTIIKLLSNVAVIILNYVLSRLFVFRQKAQ